jgi:hypothetical protein
VVHIVRDRGGCNADADRIIATPGIPGLAFCPWNA